MNKTERERDREKSHTFFLNFLFVCFLFSVRVNKTQCEFDPVRKNKDLTSIVHI